MEIYDLTVRGCDFNAYINAFDLPRAVVEELNIEEDSVVSIAGDYYVQFDNGTPLVIVSACYATDLNGQQLAPCNSFVTDYFQELIQDQLLETWDAETKDLEREAAQYESDSDAMWDDE